MILEGDRVRLRPWRKDDRAPFAAINAEPAVQRYLEPITREFSDAMLERIDAHFESHGWGFWAVEHRDSAALIGLCGLAQVRWRAFFTPAVEIGWRLSTPFHGKGLAREAATLALDAAFGPVGLERVVSFTVPANTASWGLIERLGMRRLGEFDHPRLREGSPLRRHVAYAIIAPEWLAQGRLSRTNPDRV
ncbi:MAG: GNAT family N-acetyltransferase [Acetobacteraceae bacterium]